MAVIKCFEDIIAWQKTRELASSIWKLSQVKPFSKDFGLCDQINRAAGSAMDYTAEGYGRDGNKELLQFLFYAKGSLDEVKSHLYRALDREHIGESVFHETTEKHSEAVNVLIGFIKYIKNSNYKGVKYD